MSDVVTGVRDYLLSKSAVTSLVGGSTGCTARIRPGVLAQGEGDEWSVVISLVSRDSTEHLGGAAGLAKDRVQVKCYHSILSSANTLREAVRGVMQGYRGTMGDLSDVRSVEVAGAYDIHEPPVSGQVTGRFAAIIDFMVTHSESIPSYP